MKRYGLPLLALTMCHAMIACAPKTTHQSPSCPPLAAVQENISKTFTQPRLTVQRVSPTAMTNLCEVRATAGNATNEKKQIVYVDSSNTYIFLGEIIDSTAKQNVTKASLAEWNRFTPEDIKTLENLTAFTLGPQSAPHTIFFITDPECSFCETAEPVLKELTDQGLLRVHFLLYSGSEHLDGRDVAASIMCDNKGYEELKADYKSITLCAAGYEKADATTAFLNSHGLIGTPGYIFPDGSYYYGILNKEQIFNKTFTK